MERSVYQQFYELERNHWWFAGMRTICRTAIQRLPGLAGDGANKCLDIGCGTGLWTKELEAFGKVWGLDVAPEALLFCRRRGINRLVRATAEYLPFANASCHLITAVGVIEHLDDDVRFISDLYRVCKPGRYVLLVTSAYGFLWSQHDEIVHHKRRYTKAELRRLLSDCGFDVVKVSYVNMFLFPLILAIRLLQKVMPSRAHLPRKGSPDVFRVPVPINQMLYVILLVEAKLLKRINLPFGVGLLAIARKPEG